MTEGSATAATIDVEVGKCIGAGNCADVAPRHFDQDPDTGLVVVVDETVSDGDLAKVQEAASLCPVAAIRVRRVAQGA